MSLAQRIRARLDRHDARTKKRFGQNFLIDENMLHQIAEAAVKGASTVLEIGPGPGTLTEALLDRGVDVVAIEKDPEMVRLLGAELSHPKLEVIEGDILDVDLEAVAPGAHVAGNIPYNVSAPILIKLLSLGTRMGPATLMIQKEVADRILSPPGSKSYGSLSVMLQMFGDVSRVAKVPPGAFMPPPKVHSTVIRIAWLPAPRFDVPDIFERVVRAAFSQRRKMLRNSLQTAFDVSGLAAVDLSRRAETLSLEEFAALATEIAQRSAI